MNPLTQDVLVESGKALLKKLAPAVSGVASVVVGPLLSLKNAMDSEAKDNEIKILKRHLQLIKLHGSEGLKIQYWCHYLAADGNLAYALSGKHGGIAWSDRETGGLFWHPDSQFSPMQSVYWYFQKKGAKPHNAIRLPAGKRA